MMIKDFILYEVYLYEYHDEFADMVQPNYPADVIKEIRTFAIQEQAFHWAQLQIAFLKQLDIDNIYEAAIYGIEKRDRIFIGYV